MEKTVVGWIAQTVGWNWTFLLLVAACLLSIFFMLLTCGRESAKVGGGPRGKP